MQINKFRSEKLLRCLFHFFKQVLYLHLQKYKISL